MLTGCVAWRTLADGPLLEDWESEVLDGVAGRANALEAERGIDVRCTRADPETRPLDLDVFFSGV